LGFDLLVAALGDWGVGGKTSSGYGRLVEIDPGRRRKAFSAEALGLPAKGALVTATILEAPKKNKPWRARYDRPTGKPLNGPIEPVERTPMDIAPHQERKLIVADVNENSIQFTWPK
jgi:hypothetical protein